MPILIDFLKWLVPLVIQSKSTTITLGVILIACLSIPPAIVAFYQNESTTRIIHTQEESTNKIVRTQEETIQAIERLASVLTKSSEVTVANYTGKVKR